MKIAMIGEGAWGNRHIDGAGAQWGILFVVPR